jgi:hypothetical protein
VNWSARETVMTVEKDQQTVTLWRPVGPLELELIQKTDMSAFPPRLPEQPIFYRRNMP